MASGDDDAAVASAPGADAVSAEESDEMSYDSSEDVNIYDYAHHHDDDDDDDEDYDEDSDEAETSEDGDADAASPGSKDDAATAPAAAWMSGRVGIAWRHRPGDTEDIKNFRVATLVEDVRRIPGLGYVLFGLSGGACGHKYIAPHSVLSKINPGSCPERDLFGELATAFQAAGYKVLVYMATEGPAQLHHGARNARDEAWIENWKSYVLDTYGSNDQEALKRAYAEVIVGEYAERYGDKIDGWWFDHARFGNVPLLRDICKRANPRAILAYNGANLGGPATRGGTRGRRGKPRRLRSKTLEKNNPFADYTAGHPTPLKRALPSDARNLGMIESVEATSDGFFYAKGTANLGHVFMPMHARWNGGRGVMWTEEQAVTWMRRVLEAGGAWTWNVPLSNNTSRLRAVSNKFASRVSLNLRKSDEGNTSDEL